MICCDLNARTGLQKDFITYDGTYDLLLYQNRSIDSHCVARQNIDSILDGRGIRLINVRIGNRLRILNGKCFG